MKTYDEAIYRVATEYNHEIMQELMPRINVDAAITIAFIFEIDKNTVFSDIKDMSLKIREKIK